MKKRVCLSLLFLMIVSGLSAQNTSISKLWSDFEKAKASDLPQQELEIIESIKQQASLEKSSWDYYKACESERDIRQAVNWKDRKKAEQDFVTNIVTFRSPIADFFLVKDKLSEEELLAFVKRNKDKLKAGCDRNFYYNDFYIKSIAHPFGKVLGKILANNYDYALWRIFLKYKNISVLNDCSEKDYPFNAFAEYYKINFSPSVTRSDQLDAFALKYDGTATALIAEDEIIRIRFDELVRDGGNSEQFKDIRSDCKFLEKKKSKFSGLEKEIASLCQETHYILVELESKDLSCTVADDTLQIFLRNLATAHTIIRKDGNAVLSFNSKNTTGSYYAIDTVIVFLPSKLDDGTYEIECSSGETKYCTVWDKYTLSLAVCRSAEGYRALVTDYYTGEPVKGYEQGFQQIGREEFQAELIENGRKRLSRKMRLGTILPDYKPREEKYSCIICDRKVFKPQESVNFKVYHSPGGIVKVFLKNPSSEVTDSITLKLNEFGTAAGSFELNGQKKIGNFIIDVKQDNSKIASTRILVQDFKLPSFNIKLEKNDRVYIPGDTATISGTIISYSGHSLSEARKTYTIGIGDEMISGDVATDANGHFSIRFPVSAKGSYPVSVKVADMTGEVCEATQNISTWFYHHISVLNADKGSANGYGYSIVSSDQARVEFKGCKHPVEKVRYTVEENGRIIASSVAEGDTAINIPLHHSGLFRIESAFCDQKEEAFILHVTDNDTIAPKGIQCFFRELWDDELALQTGSENENHWTVAEIFSPDNKLLDSKTLKGTGTIRFEWKTEYPDVIALRAVSFAKGEGYYYSMVRRRNTRSMMLPLSVSRFTDKTSPASTGYITIETSPDAECALSIYDKSCDDIYPMTANLWEPFSPFEISPSTVNYNILEGTNGMNRRIGLTKTADGIALMFGTNELKGMVSGMPEIDLRSDFGSTILWEPMLRPDSNGSIPVTFQTKDGTGTFVVRMFAHDKDFNNAVLAKEMLVSLPLEISVNEPAFLYEGDSYTFRATVSNTMNSEVTGTCTVKAEGAHTSGSAEISIPAHGSAHVEFKVNVPQTDKIDMIVLFDSALGNDAVKVSIPVRKPVQLVSESHSALINSESDRKAIEDSLRNAFANIDASGLAVSERSIAEMVEQAYPKDWKPKHNDAISLSSSLYLGTDYVDELLSCRGNDGGFSWMPGMESSTIVTAVVLERMKVRKEAFEGYIEDAVRYLDHSYFSKEKPSLFRPALSMQQYLFVRSLFPEIKCNEIIDRQWIKESRAYLSGKSERNDEGMILYKARRAVTNMNFGKHRSAVKADIRSLKQYAVGHPAGGRYFPNAIRYFRGLLENELYAHVKLSELFERSGETSLADDIRLWIMVQKETQDWGNNPALADAVNCVRKASDRVLSSKVIAMKAEKELPFKDIGSASNGISIETIYESDTLESGTKIKATYKIRSDENRSFVLLTIPRCAGLTPVDKISQARTPFIYRNVLSDKTEYWMEVCAEEQTVLTEEFFVSQKGDFQMPAPTIECLYAPHYRGNGTSSQKHFSDSLTTNVLPPM